MSKDKDKNKKKKKKQAFKPKDLVDKVKTQLDPKVRASRVKFVNENGRRLTEMYSIVAGVVIIGITVSTTLLPLNDTYPFNYSNSESVKTSVGLATTKANDIDKTIKDAVSYADEVAVQKERIEGLYGYLPGQVDPLSFMVYVEELAKDAGVDINTLILPENRRSAVLTDDLDITTQGSTSSNNSEPNVEEKDQDNGSLLGGIDTESNEEEQESSDSKESNESNNSTNANVTYQDNAYVIDIKLVGMYTKLTAFFKELEQTREIIEISDVQIKEYEKIPLDEYGNPIPEDRREEEKVNLDEFDMNKVTTEISFKVKLYDKNNFDLVKVEQNDSANNTGGQ